MQAVIGIMICKKQLLQFISIYFDKQAQNVQANKLRILNKHMFLSQYFEVYYKNSENIPSRISLYHPSKTFQRIHVVQRYFSTKNSYNLSFRAAICKSTLKLSFCGVKFIINQKAEMKELRNKLNKRRRKRFRTHQVTEVFKCFCKREYLSYPALYLHVKLKHQHRITAKDQVTKLNLVNEEKHDFKKVTRLYQLQWLQGKRSRKKLRTKHRSKTDVIPQRRSTRDLFRQESKSQTISEIIQEYCAQLQSQRMDEQFDDISLVLYLVKAYINQNYSSFDHRQPPENQNYCQTFDAKSLPFFFNFLVSRYIPQFCCMNAAKLQKHCILFDLVRLKSELKAFNEWLCTKGYSSFNRCLQ